MTILVLAAILLVAAFAIGLTGYGFGLVAMGLLPYVLSVAESNATVGVLGLLITVTAVIPLRRHVDWSLIRPLIIGAVVGVPLGVLYLVRLDERVLRMSLGVIILFALAVSILGTVGARRRARAEKQQTDARSNTHPAAATRPATDHPGETRASDTSVSAPMRLLRAVPVFLVGIVSGSFGGAFSVSGPPVVLYLNQKLERKEVIKANLLMYFTFVLALRVPFLAVSGVLTGPVLVRTGLLIPPVAAGLALGTIMHNRLPTHVVRYVIQALLAVSAFFLITAS